MLATTAPQLDSVGRSSVPAAANTWKLSRWCPGCRCRRTAARSRCRTPSSPSSWSQSSRLREWILVWPPRSTFVGDRSVLIWSGGKIEILNWYLNYWTGSVFTLPVCKIFSLFPSAYKLYYCEELLVTVKFFLFLQHQHKVVTKARLHHHPVHGACTGKMDTWEMRILRQYCSPVLIMICLCFMKSTPQFNVHLSTTNLEGWCLWPGTRCLPLAAWLLTCGLA